MNVYNHDYGNRNRERKTNAGANSQFVQIAKDVICPPYNVPPPPEKGTMQLVEEARAERRSSRCTAEAEYRAAVKAHENEIRNDPAQIAWENEQRQTNRLSREKRELPLIAKLVIALAAFMLAGMTGNDIILFIVGISIFCFFFL